MTWAAVSFKVVVLLLLIYCLLLLPWFVGVLCLVQILLFGTLCPSCFATILVGKERAGCLTLTVFPMTSGSQCSVALPHGAMG